MKKSNFNNNKLKSYARFSGIGMQMAVVIIIGVFSGKYIDEKLKLTIPWFSIFLSLTAVVSSIYLVIREVIALSKKQEIDEKDE